MNDWISETTNNLLTCCYSAVLYTYRGDSILNYGLRNNYIPEETEIIFDSITKAFENTNPIPETILYRGLRGKNFKKMKVGSIIEDKGFSSFSIEQEIAEKFAGTNGTILLLDLHENTDQIKGLFFNNKQFTSEFKEKEVLIGPGLKYQIIKKELMNRRTILHIKIISQRNIEYPIISIKDGMSKLHNKIMKYKTAVIVDDLVISKNFDFFDNMFKFFIANANNPGLWIKKDYIYNLYKMVQTNNINIYFVVNHHDGLMTKNLEILISYPGKITQIKVVDDEGFIDTLDVEAEITTDKYYTSRKIVKYVIQRKTMVTKVPIKFVSYDTKFKSKAIRAILFQNKDLLRKNLNDTIETEELFKLCIEYDLPGMALELIKLGANFDPEDLENVDNSTTRFLEFVSNDWDLTDDYPIDYLIDCPTIIEYLLVTNQQHRISENIIGDIFDLSGYDTAEKGILDRRFLIKILIVNGYIPTFNLNLLPIITAWQADSDEYLNKIMELKINIENWDYLYITSVYSFRYINSIRKSNKGLINQIFYQNLVKNNYHVIEFVLKNFKRFSVDLCAVIVENNVDILKWVIGANIKYASFKEHGNPLNLAISRNRYDMVKLLVEYGFQPDNIDYDSIPNPKIRDLLSRI